MSHEKSRIDLPPEAEPARAIIEALVDRYEKRIKELEDAVQSLTEKLQKRTPQNSSVPPSTIHPHAKPKRKPTPGKKRSKAGSQDTNAITES